MELMDVLRTHAARYPRMQPRDVVKLIYQNEFGGGHLIADAAQSLRCLREEYARVPRDASKPLLETIGGGISRVHLAALETERYPLEQLNADFVRSAALHRGSLDSFLAKLNAAARRFGELNLPFGEDAFLGCLKEYAEAGYPMVSHSEAYREAYAPAYRVVLTRLVPPTPCPRP